MTNSSSIQSMTIRAFFRSNGAFWTVRARATIGHPHGLRTHASRAPTLFASAAPNPTPKTGGGNWSRTVERTPAPVRLLFQFVAGRTRDIMRPAFPTLDTVWSGIVNLGRHPAFTAGKCFSFLYPLLKFLQEPRSVVRVSPSPTPLLSAIRHVAKHDSRRDGNARIQIGEVRNVVR